MIRTALLCVAATALCLVACEKTETDDAGPGPVTDSGSSPVPQACLGPDGCDGFLQDAGATTLCDAPRRNNCGACGAVPVQGIGASCAGIGGRNGIAVCGTDGISITCATTVVSLTVDDTFDDATRARDAFEAHGIRSTFFVNSPRFTKGSGYMTLDQVLDLQHRGHEVAGHTLDHPNLPTMGDDQVHVEICHDRLELLAAGLDIKDFAYPFGANTSATQQAARDCNYNSARQIGGVSDGSAAVAEPFVPENLFAIRTPSSIAIDTTLDDLKAYVTKAESTGGWIVINMHHIVLQPSDVVPGKESTTMLLSTLNDFLDWLQPRNAQGTIEQTIRQMVWGETQGPVDWNLSPDSNGNWLRNPSLESITDGSGIPDCWHPFGSGRNASVWDAGAPHTGAVAQTLDMDAYTNGARGLMSTHDYGGCSPVLATGRSYQLSAWYIAPESTPIFEMDYFYQGGWLTWLYSPRFEPSSTYTQAVWTTPPLPAEVQQVSVGLMLNGVGTLTVDDFSLVESP